MWKDGQLQKGTVVILDAKDSDQQQASEADAGPETVQAAVGPWTLLHPVFSVQRYCRTMQIQYPCVDLWIKQCVVDICDICRV